MKLKVVIPIRFSSGISPPRANRLSNAGLSIYKRAIPLPAGGHVGEGTGGQVADFLLNFPVYNKVFAILGVSPFNHIAPIPVGMGVDAFIHPNMIVDLEGNLFKQGRATLQFPGLLNDHPQVVACVKPYGLHRKLQSVPGGFHFVFSQSTIASNPLVSMLRPTRQLAAAAVSMMGPITPFMVGRAGFPICARAVGRFVFAIVAGRRGGHD